MQSAPRTSAARLALQEALNLKFVGVTEADYEWITDQIKQLANR